MEHKPKKRWRMSWEIWLYALPAACLLVVWGCGEDGPGGVGDSRSRSYSRNNLKQLGLGLYSYHDTHSTFPPAGIYDTKGRAHHSWQTMLLPFVEQNALYSQINFNLPWTDPANAPHFKQQIPQYQIPKLSAESTDGQGRSLSHYAGNSHIFRKNKGTRIRDIEDGTANTLLAGEVSAGFKPWGDASNVRDPAKGLGKDSEKFYGPHGDRTVFLLGDGSIREISNNVAPEILKKLATPAGMEQPDSY